MSALVSQNAVMCPCLAWNKSVLPCDPQEHRSAENHSLTRTAADSGCSVRDLTRVAVYPTKQFRYFVNTLELVTTYFSLTKLFSFGLFYRQKEKDVI